MVTVYTGSKGLDYVCTIATVTLDSSQDLAFYMYMYMHTCEPLGWPALGLMHIKFMYTIIMQTAAGGGGGQR